MKDRRHIGMVGAEGLLQNGQRPAIERLCLSIRALRPIQLREVVEAHRHIGVVSPNRRNFRGALKY